MIKEELEKLEGILKVLDKALFEHVRIADMFVMVKQINDYASAIKHLRNELKKDE